jgi:hypothetical protein
MIMPKAIALAFLIGIAIVAPAWAHSGCCSHHGGVCGCSCCDGTALSATCAPYYPGCGSGGEPPPPAPPASPVGLTAASVTNNSLELTWLDGSTDQSGFLVQEKTGSGAFQQVAAPAAGDTSVEITHLQPATAYTFRIVAENASGESTPSNQVTATTLAAHGTCSAGSTSLCLAANRFEVRATYDDGKGHAGTAAVGSITADTGYLWFFDAGNVEVVVKIVDGCGLNGHYWVFAAGLTNVEVALTVTDVSTGAMKTYDNPSKTTFVAVQDTLAFSTCP